MKGDEFILFLILTYEEFVTHPKAFTALARNDSEKIQKFREYVQDTYRKN
ncbi:hypothetical protein M1146_04135 [Patescibacteria group bacterium]|nr:hypothetical protein [Patescibacteria group bacterium]